jgi:hypothetical protein
VPTIGKFEAWTSTVGSILAYAGVSDDITRLVEAMPDEIADAIRAGKGSPQRRIGKALAKRAGRRYGKSRLYIKRAGQDAAKGRQCWTVAITDPDEDVSPVSPFPEQDSTSAWKDADDLDSSGAEVAASSGRRGTKTPGYGETGNAGDFTADLAADVLAAAEAAGWPRMVFGVLAVEGREQWETYVEMHDADALVEALAALQGRQA